MAEQRVRRPRSSKSETDPPARLRQVHPNAAGIDCGSRHHHVAVPADRDAEPVRRFKTVTPDLHRLVDSGRVNGFETTWFSIYCSDSTPSTR